MLSAHGCYYVRDWDPSLLPFALTYSWWLLPCVCGFVPADSVVVAVGAYIAAVVGGVLNVVVLVVPVVSVVVVVVAICVVVVRVIVAVMVVVVVIVVCHCRGLIASVFAIYGL